MALTRGEQALGFYMTPNFPAANYFAVRGGGDPGVLHIHMSIFAIDTLISTGGIIREMQPGGLREQVIEFFLPPTAFGTFDALRAEGEITIYPLLPPEGNEP